MKTLIYISFGLNLGCIALLIFLSSIVGIFQEQNRASLDAMDVRLQYLSEEGTYTCDFTDWKDHDCNK